MTVLRDAHADILQDIEHLNSHREDITRNMVQVSPLKRNFIRSGGPWRNEWAIYQRAYLIFLPFS